MKVLAACDLDRTLIYSVPALGQPWTPELAAQLLCVERYEGRPLSYMTHRAAADVRALLLRGSLVPVTTRTVGQYRRVRLPGPVPAYAVCANGARVLHDDVEDADYTATVARTLRDGTAPFSETMDRLESLCRTRPWVKAVRSADDLFCYVVLLTEVVPEAWLQELRQLAGELAWKLSVQERKIYLVPRGLSKWSGVAWLVERLGSPQVIAAGDSLLDEDLLDGADAGILPSHGELLATGYRGPNVTVTTAAGALAGEEVAASMRRACDLDPSPTSGPRT